MKPGSDPSTISRMVADSHSIEQVLGKALGYPWFKDDQKNFPSATEEDGVCVGPVDTVSLARQAAKRIEVLESVALAAQFFVLESENGKSPNLASLSEALAALGAINCNLPSDSERHEEADSMPSELRGPYARSSTIHTRVVRNGLAYQVQAWVDDGTVEGVQHVFTVPDWFSTAEAALLRTGEIARDFTASASGNQAIVKNRIE